MPDISPDPRQPPPPSQAHRSARLESLLKDLDRPLDDEGDWRLPSSSERGEAPSGLSRRLRHQREHRRALKRARRAAAASFGVQPKRSARRRAAMLLTAGAAGMSAFTVPSMSQFAAHESETAHAKRRVPADRLRASADLKAALMHSEGIRTTVYRDVAGYPTVGIGHLVRPGDNLTVGQTVSQAQVERFLTQDLRQAEGDVRALVGPLPLFQHEFDALVDLVFNVGIGNLSPDKSPRLNAALDAGDYDAVASQLDYRFAGGEFVRGLENRSDRRTAMFAAADYPGEPSTRA